MGYPRRNRVSGEIDVNVVKQPEGTLMSNNFNFDTDHRRPSNSNPDVMSFGVKQPFGNANYAKNRATAGFKTGSSKRNSSMTNSDMTSSHSSSDSKDSKKHRTKNSRSNSGTHSSLMYPLQVVREENEVEDSLRHTDDISAS